MNYIRPYVPGAVTTPGFIVVCVPGVKPLEVAETLATRVTDLVVKKQYDEARQLIALFSDLSASDVEG